MKRALCPVCHTPQPLTTHQRIQPHRRKTESLLVRDRYGNLGTPCEGAGRLPIIRTKETMSDYDRELQEQADAVREMSETNEDHADAKGSNPTPNPAPNAAQAAERRTPNP